MIDPEMHTLTALGWSVVYAIGILLAWVIFIHYGYESDRSPLQNAKDALLLGLVWPITLLIYWAMSVNDRLDGLRKHLSSTIETITLTTYYAGHRKRKDKIE